MARHVEEVTRFADMLAAMGTEPRLRIVRLLLSGPPGRRRSRWEISRPGLEDVTASTLSHHLEKLKHEGLVSVRREDVSVVLGEYEGRRTPWVLFAQYLHMKQGNRTAADPLL